MAFARGVICRREPDHAAADDENLFRHRNRRPRFPTAKPDIEDPEKHTKPIDEIQIRPWAGLHSVPPHPGPLPWGEGEWSTASRSHPCRNSPNDHRLNTN